MMICRTAFFSNMLMALEKQTTEYGGIRCLRCISNYKQTNQDATVGSSTWWSYSCLPSSNSTDRHYEEWVKTLSLWRVKTCFWTTVTCRGNFVNRLCGEKGQLGGYNNLQGPPSLLLVMLELTMSALPIACHPSKKLSHCWSAHHFYDLTVVNVCVSIPCAM